MPYRSYFLALLAANILLLLIAAIFLVAKHDVFTRIVERLKQGPVQRWETERRKFALYEANQKPGMIVMLGNSLTQQAHWAELTGDARVVNRGISGETVDRMLERAEDLVSPRPALVCIMGGINDLLYFRRPLARVEAQYDSLIDTFTSQGIPVVVFSTLPTTFDQNVNRQIVALNQHLARHAHQDRQNLVTYVDLWPAMARDGKLRPDIALDGLHLNEKGYAAWAAELAPHLPPPATATATGEAAP